MQEERETKKAHFIGICGVGMYSVAAMLKREGWEISGSDEGFYPPVSEKLKASGIALKTPYKKENIPSDAEIIIIGKNAKLTPEENEEVAAAFESGIPVGSFPDILSDLTEGLHSVVVAGSYGKSTCTALLAHVLVSAGKDPSYFIGAFPRGMEESAYLGEGDVFVLEGDEYPAANWDSSSKFLHYHATDVLLTSAAHDHVNVFPTLEEYLKPFQELLGSLPKHGLLVANVEEAQSKLLFQYFDGKKASYGLGAEAMWSARDITYGPETTFTLTKSGEGVAELTTTLLGKHNVENIVGVSAMLRERELVTPRELQKGIASFRGIERRLDLKSEKTTVPVYEGFGSSKEKARAAMEAMKLHYPEKRLIVVFEPHTFTWRNKEAIEQYDTAFELADMVLVYEPATQGAGTHAQATQEEIVARMQSAGVDTRAIHTKKDGLSILEKELSENDVVLMLTSGDLGGLITAIPDFAETHFSRG